MVYLCPNFVHTRKMLKLNVLIKSQLIVIIADNQVFSCLQTSLKFRVERPWLRLSTTNLLYNKDFARRPFSEHDQACAG